DVALVEPVGEPPELLHIAVDDREREIAEGVRPVRLGLEAGDERLTRGADVAEGFAQLRHGRRLRRSRGWLRPAEMRGEGGAVERGEVGERLEDGALARQRERQRVRREAAQQRPERLDLDQEVAELSEQRLTRRLRSRRALGHATAPSAGSSSLASAWASAMAKASRFSRRLRTVWMLFSRLKSQCCPNCRFFWRSR